jgi:hypothetical protein
MPTKYRRMDRALLRLAALRAMLHTGYAVTGFIAAAALVSPYRLGPFGFWVQVCIVFMGYWITSNLLAYWAARTVYRQIGTRHPLRAELLVALMKLFRVPALLGCAGIALASWQRWSELALEAPASVLLTALVAFGSLHWAERNMICDGA